MHIDTCVCWAICSDPKWWFSDGIPPKWPRLCTPTFYLHIRKCAQNIVIVEYTSIHLCIRCTTQVFDNVWSIYVYTSMCKSSRMTTILPLSSLDLTYLTSLEDLSSYMIITSTKPPRSLANLIYFASKKKCNSWKTGTLAAIKSWGIHDSNNPRDFKLRFWSFRTRRHILRPSSGSLEKKRKPKTDPLRHRGKTKVETGLWWRKATFLFMVFLWGLVGLVPVLVEDIKSMLSQVIV